MSVCPFDTGIESLICYGLCNDEHVKIMHNWLREQVVYLDADTPSGAGEQQYSVRLHTVHHGHHVIDMSSMLLLKSTQTFH